MIAFDPEWFKNQAGWNRERNHQELLALNAALGLGVSQHEVRVVLARPEFSHLELLGADGGSEEWWVYTPLEFGAQNWILGLQFTDGRLSATRVRMADGDFHPIGAPLDRGSWGRLATRSERAG
jgi:hypothetical protein